MISMLCKSFESAAEIRPHLTPSDQSPGYGAPAAVAPNGNGGHLNGKIHCFIHIYMRQIVCYM